MLNLKADSDSCRLGIRLAYQTAAKFCSNTDDFESLEKAIAGNTSRRKTQKALLGSTENWNDEMKVLLGSVENWNEEEGKVEGE
ncbi:hypothetical protein V6N11_072699 [Hibiscus sabdariffa]|uniref:Uncharacterized protein n=1 Tax=Hibiscus sabdariffa TaxID=183260 RepID=A0ABR1Z9T0_9ROSI